MLKIHTPMAVIRPHERLMSSDINAVMLKIHTPMAVIRPHERHVSSGIIQSHA